MSDPHALVHDGACYLSCSGYYATADSPEGPYIYRGLVGNGWCLDTPYAHGDFFSFRGATYHVWCCYRDRSVDRIRDAYLAPVHYLPDGRMEDDLSHLRP
jgi:hypothetical protein